MGMREDLAVPSSEPYVFRTPVVFQSTVEFSELPNASVGKTAAAATSANVLNTSRLALQSVSAVNLTAFSNGAEGQQLVVFGDGNTTVVHGTSIKTNTGSNKLMASNRVYVFYYYNGVWYEH